MPIRLLIRKGTPIPLVNQGVVGFHQRGQSKYPKRGNLTILLESVYDLNRLWDSFGPVSCRVAGQFFQLFAKALNRTL